MSRLKYLNLIMVVPERRLLLRRQLGGTRPSPQWSCTIEQFLENHEDAMPVARRLLYEIFKIKPSFDISKDISVTTLPPVVSVVNKFIEPILAWPKVHLSFRADPTDEFYAMSFEDLLDDIMANSMYPAQGHFSKHTITCIHVARALHERRTFG